jgi:hypothetical protein
VTEYQIMAALVLDGCRHLRWLPHLVRDRRARGGWRSDEKMALRAGGR